MLEEYLARAMHADRIQELERDRIANEARQVLGLPRPSLLAFFRRRPQPAASRASSAAIAAGQPVSSIE